MAEVKRYTVKIKYVVEHFQEVNPYATDEAQAAAIALKMLHDTMRDAENKLLKVIEIKEFKPA